MRPRDADGELVDPRDVVDEPYEPVEPSRTMRAPRLVPPSVDEYGYDRAGNYYPDRDGRTS